MLCGPFARFYGRGGAPAGSVPKGSVILSALAGAVRILLASRHRADRSSEFTCAAKSWVALATRVVGDVPAMIIGQAFRTICAGSSAGTRGRAAANLGNNILDNSMA
jgi:hypothetical protein